MGFGIVFHSYWNVCIYEEFIDLVLIVELLLNYLITIL